MGQAQSDVASETATTQVQGRDQTVSSSSSSPSMESLLAEAAAYGEEGDEESLDAKAQKALECPCIADLRTGSCGDQFSEAFLCFLKSTAEEKGSDCVHPFVALQNCIKSHPDAFSKGILEEDDDEVKKVEEPVQDYKIYPPKWAKEPQSPKSKL